MICRVLRDDVPESSKEVAQNQDEENKAEDSEDIHDVDLIHNLVVVFLHGLHSRVLFYTVIQASTVQLLEQSLEFLSIQ